MNKCIIVSAIFFIQSVFTVTQAQSGLRANHKFVKHFDNYLQTQLKQALPLGLLGEVNFGELLNQLLLGKGIIICHNLCTIDMHKGGYRDLDRGLSQRVSSLEGLTWRRPSEKDNFNSLKESIYSHMAEIFSAPGPGSLKYGKVDGSVIMISDGIWYQYPFVFDGYAKETITIADTVVKDPANAFRLRTDTQPIRSFSANLMLRIGKPQHQYLVASGYYWRNLAEKFGESVVKDWYNGIVSPTPEQLDQVVNFLYSNTSKEYLLDDLYMSEQLLRQWRSSVGLGEPLVSNPDKSLARDLAEHRDMILAGEYGVTSSRDLITKLLDQRNYEWGSNEIKMRLIDLRPESYPELSSRRLSHLTYDLITRHLGGELVVDQRTMEIFFEVLRSRDLKVYYFKDRVYRAIVFERLFHRYHLAKKANHDLSEIDPQLREVLDRYQY